MFLAMGVVAGFAGYMFVSTLADALWWAPDTGMQVPRVAMTAVASSSPPERLLIPSLNVDAAVQTVGVTIKGTLGAPSNYTDVGWYRGGTIPGQRGSAVIDGHVDNGLSLPGVFKELSEIKKGAAMYVLTQDGHAIRFVVTDIERYPYQNAPMDLIFNRQDAARLNLITCDGIWVAGERTYDERLVVFAEQQKS